MSTAVFLKIEAHNVSASNIIFCTDSQQLNLKAIAVNSLLADFCKENNFSLIVEYFFEYFFELFKTSESGIS